MANYKLAFSSLSVKNRWELLLIAAMAAGSLATFGQYYLREVGHLDPWFYTALINDYFGLVDRFGATYYASRIGHIWPAALFELLFGIQWGALGYKYALLFCGGAGAYLYGVVNFDRRVGLIGSAVVLGSPWLISQFTGDLYSGAVGVYLLLALAAAFTSVGNIRLMTVLAAIFAGIAIHTYQLVAGIFFFVLPAWLYARYALGDNWLMLLRTGSIAFVLTYACLQGLLYLAHPAWRVAPWDDPSAQMSFALTVGGLAENWWNPLTGSEGRLNYLLLPMFVAFGLMLSYFLKRRELSERQRLSLLSASFLAILPYGYYLLIHFVFKGGALTWDFSASFIFPPTLLALLALLALMSSGSSALEASWSSRTRDWTVALGVFLILIFMRPGLRQLFVGLQLLEFVFIGIVCLLLVALQIPRHILAVLPLTLFFSAAPFTLYNSNLLHASPGEGQRQFSVANVVDFSVLKNIGVSDNDGALTGVGWDIKKAIGELQSAIKAAALPENGKLGFWYDERVPELNSLQSSFFWGYSRAFVSDDVVFPNASSDSQANWDSLNFLAVLVAHRGRPDSRLVGDQAVNAERTVRDYSERRGRSVDVVGRKLIPGNFLSFEVLIFAFVPPRAPPIVPSENSIGFLSVTDVFVPRHLAPASTSIDKTGRFVIVAPRSGYSALLRVGPLGGEAQPGRIAVWALVERGGLSISASEFNNSGVIFDTDSVGWSPNQVYLTVDVPDLSIPIDLLFGNPSQVESRVVIQAMEVSLLGSRSDLGGS